MSLRPFWPGHLGLVIPQDPVTGLARPDALWAADRVESVVGPRTYEGAYHPIQGGALGTTDAVLRRPHELQVVYRVSNTWTAETLLRHPRKDWIGPDRAVRAFETLAAIHAAREPVTVVVRVWGQLVDYLFLGLSPESPLDAGEIRLTATFRDARIVGHSLIEPIQDADLAASAQVVTFGVLA